MGLVLSSAHGEADRKNSHTIRFDIPVCMNMLAELLQSVGQEDAEVKDSRIFCVAADQG